MALSTVLIVDDDEPTRGLIDALMRRYGIPTANASNGAEAIDMLQAREFAAVILDLMMPTVGGRDVIAYLEKAPRKVPVIVCTAAGRTGIGDFDPAIVKAVLRKPFDIDQMVMTVKAIVGNQ